LQKLLEELVACFGSDRYYDIAQELERVAGDRLGERGIWPNVDFYSGLVYRRLGIDTDLFTPIFAIARVAGWLAHWKEQLETNRIYRPTQMYVGKHHEPYIPMDKR
jgi:citrate synthase